jgi:hypothetical protein
MSILRKTMSSMKWLALAAWAMLPLAATAQQEHSSHTVSQPAASGGPVQYQSAFEDYRPFQEEGPTPDKVWRQFNEEMEMLGGHAGHMKDPPPVLPGASRHERTAVRQSSEPDHSQHQGGGKE